MRRRSLVGASVLLASAVAITPAGSQPVEAARPPTGFSDTAVAGVDRATAVEWLPSGQVVVLEQRTGRVKVGEPGGSLTTALDVGALCTTSERGLLGFTHDPAFLGNGWVYVYYTHDTGGRMLQSRESFHVE
ncbi:MAG: PQQ-dependent sugar dehydrogenase [Ilumatobacteraceae bacterium]